MQLKDVIVTLTSIMAFGPAVACLPPDVSWRDALNNARGASIFSVEKISSSQAADVVLFRPKSVVHDSGIKDMPFVTVALEQSSEEIVDEKRSLTFWAGLQKALDYRGGNCTLWLRVDYSKDYLVLWGHHGPYAIEPLRQGADEWVEITNRRFMGEPVVPALDFEAIMHGLREIRIGKCSIRSGASLEWDAFANCVEDIYPAKKVGASVVVAQLVYKRGTVMVDVDYPSFALSEKHLEARYGVTVKDDVSLNLADFSFEIAR